MYPATPALQGSNTPATNSVNITNGNSSTRLRCVLIVLLKSSHCSTFHFVENLPLPVSGYPCFGGFFPVSFSNCCPKCCSRYSGEKCCFLLPMTGPPNAAHSIIKTTAARIGWV